MKQRENLLRSETTVTDCDYSVLGPWRQAGARWSPGVRPSGSRKVQVILMCPPGGLWSSVVPGDLWCVVCQYSISYGQSGTKSTITNNTFYQTGSFSDNKHCIDWLADWQVEVL